MIAFFLLTKPKASPLNEDGRKKVIDILNLDERQHDDFLKNANEHGRRIRDLDDRQRSLLKPYFYSLVEPIESMDSDSMLSQLILLERSKIESTYNHFRDVKTILRPEQLENFKAFIDHALGRIQMKKIAPAPQRR